MILYATNGDINILPSVNNGSWLYVTFCFLTGMAFGVLYSLLFPLLGPRYLHFLTFVSVLHTVTVGIVIGLLFSVTGWFVKTYESDLFWLIPAGLIGLHSAYWLLFYSSLAFFQPAIRLPGALAIALFLLGIVALRGTVLEDSSPGKGPLISLSIFVLVIVFIKTTVILSLPRSSVNNWITKDHPHARNGPDGIAQIIYPLSVPLEESLSDYDRLLPEPAEGPKIVTVVLDAFREDYFDKTMKGIPLTPNMSEFARKHDYFSNYYVQSNWTKPSVASFFTGKYVREHKTFKGSGKGALGKRNQIEISTYTGHELPETSNTLAERLSDRGYKNAAYVSIPHISRTFNFDQGFDHYRTSKLRELREVYYGFRSILYWLLTEQPKKSFIYLHLQGPHFNFREGSLFNPEFWKRTRFQSTESVPEHWSLPHMNKLIEGHHEALDQTKHQTELDILRLAYASDVNYYDKHVFTRITDSLKNLGIFRESFFVLTADHGENLFDHEKYFGHLKYLHEEVINVPLLMKLPGAGGTSIPEFLSEASRKIESIDLTATLLDFAGGDTTGVTGNSFLYPSGKNDAFRWALAEETRDNSVKTATVNQSHWKYVHHYEDDNGLLFDLRKKEGEKDPVTDSRNKLNELRRILFTQLGPDGTFSGSLPRIKTLSPSQESKLEGLGYVN